MKTYVLLFVSYAVVAETLENDSIEISREQRRTAGALHILTNHAQPIHADVKPEGGIEVTENPCKDNNTPSPIEPGVVFQVIPPTDTTYEQKSLRKSLPLTNKLDVIRSVTRITTLVVLIVSAILEFYPMLQLLHSMLYSFIYVK